MNISISCTPAEKAAAIIPVLAGSAPAFTGPQQKALFDGAVQSRRFSAKRGELFSAPFLTDGALSYVLFVGLGSPDELCPRHVFNAMFGAFSTAASLMLDSLQVLFNDPALSSCLYLEKAAEAAVLAQYRCAVHKTGAPPHVCSDVTFISDIPDGQAAIGRAMICGRNTNLARRMVDASSVELSPRSFADAARQAAGQAGFECSVFGQEEIAAMGMNAFLAVARGSDQEPALTVMRYTGNPGGPRLALVGKGVTFDSGGYNMKRSCTGMNGDMGGAASVLAAVKSAAELGLKVNVTGVVAACENLVSGHAYLPGEVIRSMNGKTIEVDNTDCEGRLTLCDAITYAVRREHADVIIDIATLTGSVLTATGNETAGMISSSDELAQALMTASEISCEKIWRLPLDHDLMYAYDSAVADIKNCASGAQVGAGSSLAGMFLEDFAESRPWAHLDVACAEWNRHIAHAPKVGSSAFGTRLLCSVLRLFADTQLPVK